MDNYKGKMSKKFQRGSDNRFDLNRENEMREQFYKMFENHQMIMLFIDPASKKVVQANEAACNYYGYTLEEMVSKDIAHIFYNEERSTLDSMLRDIKHYHRNHFLTRNLLKSREVREVEIHCYPVILQDQELIFTIVHDILSKWHLSSFFDVLFLNLPSATVLLDENKKIVNINKSFTTLFQYELKEIHNFFIDDVMISLQNKQEVDDFSEKVYQGEMLHQETIRTKRDGTTVDVEIIGYPIISFHRVVGAIITYIDRTKRVSYEKQLQLFREVLENTDEGVIITNEKAEIIWVNKAYEAITGYTFGEVIGGNPRMMNSGTHDKQFFKNMWKDINKLGKWDGEIWNRNKNEDIYPQWLSIRKIANEEDFHYVGVIQELSERKRISRQMKVLQEKDRLTGLPNRDYFMEYIDDIIVKSNLDCDTFAIIFIEMTNFKEINDSLGHYFGDQLLLAITERLNTVVKQEGHLSRFGGDDFVLLLNNSENDQETYDFASRVLSELKEVFRLENTMIYVTPSIGISRFPRDGNDSDELIRFANMAKSVSEMSTVEHIHFYENELSEQMKEKFTIANLLKGAVLRDELYLNYQPILDISTGEIVKLEALIRWNNSEIGLISPVEFIANAERTGQIIELGEWVIEKACRQILEWRKKGIKLVPIALNISVKQLEQPHFAEGFRLILKAFEVKSSLIEIEITESVSKGNLDTIIKNILELKKLGIRVSMDDFGTGYSSFGKLHELQLNYIKIDKSFIDDIEKRKESVELIVAMIALAKGLRLKVVAEGIEKKEQLDVLKELGCDFVQGYYFNKPVDPSKVEKLLL